MYGSDALVKADIITSQGNTTPAFTSTHPTSAAVLAAQVGSPAPFNAVCGNINTTNCSASWTFNYSFPTGQTVIGATLSLGIDNLDSSVAGNQVASYLVDGTDLTATLNTVAEALDGGAGSTRNEYDVLTVNIPSTVFTTLQGGSTNVSLALQGPGLGVLGTTKDLAADLVFSTLDIQTATSSVPEPAALPLLLTAVGVLGVLRLRRKPNREI